jgi:serine/threonine-protein kinase
MIAVGDLIEGKYRLTSLLGTGGWGSVFEGENVRTLHRVAIKVLHTEMSGRTDSIVRFEREAQAAGKIGSDHIIEVFDLGQLTTGEHFMVMELLEGEDLATRLSFGVIPPPMLASIMIQVLEGLGAAHAAGILHRDLKPANLFLLRSKNGADFVKILDFGISKFGATPATQTQTGSIMGSPCYMSPEQARGAKNIDARSDLFSLGVVLFECVTGTLPFDGANFHELLFKIALSDAPDPRTVLATIDPGFAAIVLRALARDPATRYQTCAEFQEALVAWMAQSGHALPEPSLRRGGRSSASSKSASRGLPPSDPHIEDTVALTDSAAALRPLGASFSPPTATSVTLVGARPARPRWVGPVAIAVPVVIVVGLLFAKTRTSTVERAVTVEVTSSIDAAPHVAASVVAVDSAALSASPPPSATASGPASASAPPVPTSPRLVPSSKHVVAVSTTASAPPSATAIAAPSASSSAPPTVEGRRIRPGL